MLEISKPYLYQHTKWNEMQTGYTDSGGIAISESKSVCNLGIDMSIDASFHMHITQLAIKCSLPAKWILKTFRLNQRETIMVCWKTHSLSRLDCSFKL